MESGAVGQLPILPSLLSSLVDMSQQGSRSVRFPQAPAQKSPKITRILIVQTQVFIVTTNIYYQMRVRVRM